MSYLATISKALGALTAGITVLISNNLLSGTAEHWVTGLLATLGAFLAVYAFPKNKEKVQV